MLESVIALVDSDTSVREVANLGWCRLWTSRMMDSLEKWAIENKIVVEIEPREIFLSSEYSHTFVRVMFEDEEPILLDGVGWGNHLPYFGYESDAPEPMKKSHMDWMIKIDRENRRNNRLK